MGHGELGSTFLFIYFGLGVIISGGIVARVVAKAFLLGDALVALYLGLLLLDRGGDMLSLRWVLGLTRHGKTSAGWAF